MSNFIKQGRGEVKLKIPNPTTLGITGLKA